MENYENIKKIANNCLNCKKPLCVEACPMHNPIPSILNDIKNDHLDMAKDKLFTSSKVTLVCSKLCDFERSCAGKCILAKKGKGIPFYMVEAYLAKSFCENTFVKSQNGKKVAIIGAGISGITCAISLAKDGYSVYLFDKNAQIGGVLTESIPSFRFDKSILINYAKLLDDLGVKVYLNKTLGQDFTLDDLNSFKCIIMALGTQGSRSVLNKTAFLIDGISVLKNIDSYKATFAKKKILVIGGGNVAMDVARTVKRMDAMVHIVYRRDILSAPASKKEITDALNEGIIFDECLAPIKLITENNTNYLEVEKMQLEEHDTHAKKAIIPTGEFRKMTCDYVIEAVGEYPSYEYLEKAIPTFAQNKETILANGYFKYHEQIIFLTGDYLIGASSFAKASAMANKTIKKLEEIT